MGASFGGTDNVLSLTGRNKLNGSAPNSIVTELLTKFEGQSSAEQDIVIRDTAGSLYAGKQACASLK